MTYPDEMFEEAERREREVQENIERAIELDKGIECGYRKERILERYNNFYNIECSGLAHGTPITPEFQQAMALECMLDALRCENLNHEFDSIQTADLSDLIDGLYQQGKDYLERAKQ
jgi:hypothetical protein